MGQLLQARIQDVYTTASVGDGAASLRELRRNQYGQWSSCGPDEKATSPGQIQQALSTTSCRLGFRRINYLSLRTQVPYYSALSLSFRGQNKPQGGLSLCRLVYRFIAPNTTPL
jgi:hypothetical protein